MGKHGKKQRHQHKPSHRGSSYNPEEEEDNSYGYVVTNDSNEQYPLSLPSSSASKLSLSEDEKESEEEKEDQNDINPSTGDVQSKFLLYQQSVQSPKGDISYLQKFFLTYVGGRLPLHLQEDFCGTALLSAEWLRSDARRTAVGLDLDLEALNWCMENNVNKIGADGTFRCLQEILYALSTTVVAASIAVESWFHISSTALNALSRKGGIFVMDLYGGTSSECELRLQRRFPNFTYVWEQAGFDIIQRKTRISLHFHLQKPKRKLRHAFSYSWRLWSLPEIKDCLEEAGFRSVHFWIRQMPDTEEIRSIEGFGQWTRCEI
ncbi:hypothetical protein F0562_001857 [Nyssa sinensis]|uniref:Methyltransferase domain-containing protein n=1 Tax=Nyssa sinensis TaxID=561372 RepID=A0A5J5C459_9ASTE|nr:hypothetical protein F0562_001857 [Nyssa sinensis]